MKLRAYIDDDRGFLSTTSFPFFHYSLLMDTPNIFEQLESPAVSQPAARPRSASTRKATATPVASGLHSLQERAIRLIAFAQDDVPQDQTIGQYISQFTNQFLTEAVARHLNRAQRQGAELPPKLLAQLTELQLLK